MVYGQNVHRMLLTACLFDTLEGTRFVLKKKTSIVVLLNYALVQNVSIKLVILRILIE